MMEHILRSENQLISERNNACHDRDIDRTVFVYKKKKKGGGQ